MKFTRLLSIVIAGALPCAAAGRAQTAPNAAAQAPNPAASQAPAQAADQAPDEMIKKLSELVHAGRYDEARQSVAGLLILYPDDQRLVKAKALLDKSPAANAAASAQPAAASDSGAGAAPASSDPAAQLKGMDRVDYDALLETARQAQQTTDLKQQKTLLQQFTNQSGPFLEKHPEQTLLWQLRAAAALALNDPDEGYEAGQKLLAAGAAETQDANLLRLMAQLKNKNWLDAEGVAAAKAQIENDKKYGWLIGTWDADHTWFQKAAFDYGKRENHLKIEFVRSGDAVVGYVIRHDTGQNAKVPFLRYVPPAYGRPDVPCWSFNDDTPVKWQQPVESFSMGNDGNTFQVNMKYLHWTFAFTKVSDTVSDTTTEDAQRLFAEASQPSDKKRRK